MKEKNRVDIRDSVTNKYRIKDRLLSSTGELDWPLFLAIIRVAHPKKKTYQDLTEEALLKKYTPTAVLVDQSGNMRYIHGQTDLYLEPVKGYTGVNNVLRLVRNKLRRDLNITLHKAVTKHIVVNSPELRVKMNGETITVKLTVIPLQNRNAAGQAENFYLIIFDTKNEQVNRQKEIPQKTKKISESHISQELNGLHNSLVLKEIELAQKNKNLELEKLDMDLEISKSKLHSVRENIYLSEMELQTVSDQITISKDTLKVLNNELIEAKNELKEILLIPESMSQELLPMRQELETIKNELNLANQELNGKKEELRKINQEFKIQPQEMSSFISEEISDTNSALHDEVSVKETQNSEPNCEKGAYSLNANTSAINDKGMGFFSKNEPKPFTPVKNSRAFGSESNATMKKELIFKDIMEFQAVADHGFRHNKEIKSVIIPEGVEVVKRSMFYKCTQLEKVSFPNSLKIIEDFAFYGCEKLNNIELGNCKFLETIGTSAFEGCTSFTELVIPASVIGIEEASFLGCKGIETVEFQDDSQLEFLGSHVFKDCVRIKKIILPDQIEHIGSSCFYNCHNLVEIHLSKELQTVGEYAFWGCDSLIEIEIPSKKLIKQPGFTIGFPNGIKHKISNFKN